MEKELLKEGGKTVCPIAVMVRDGKILRGKRHYTKDKWKKVSVWTMPGGRCDRSETVEDTLRREVAEEVGITDFEILDFIGSVPGAKEGDIVPIFYCKTSQDAKLMEPEKFSEWRWVPLEDYISGESNTGFNFDARRIITAYLRGVAKRKPV